MNSIYFRLAYRYIIKNKLSSFINIVGFSIGIASFLFIFLFLKNELSFDASYPNSDKLYRVVTNFKSESNSSNSGFTYFPVAKDLKNEVSGIEDYCRVSPKTQGKVLIDEQFINVDNIRFADKNIFSFFNFKLISGNLKTALNSPNSTVISKKKAFQLFGTQNPIGEIITYNETPFTVTGITDNLPKNTHLTFDAIVPLTYIENHDAYYKEYGGGYTVLSYLKLQNKVTPQQIERSLPAFFNRKINQKWEGTGFTYQATLQHIKNIHLSGGTIDDDISSNRNINALYIIASICLLILALAVINYILLYTAQKIAKQKDTEILKVFGANYSNILIQTFIEIFIISSIASVLGIILLQISLPFLNTHLNSFITVKNELLSMLLILIPLLVVLSSIVTLFSSKRKSFKKLSIFSKFTSTNSKKINGNFLVSFQFSVVIILLISVLVISRQNNYLMQQNLGFSKNHIVTLKTDKEFKNNELSSFKQELLQLPEVKTACLSSQTIGSGITSNGYKIGKEEEVTLLNVLYADADFINCFSIDLVAGRNFKNNIQFDKNSILINKKLAERANWKNSINKEIYRNGTLKVVGVVDNFNFESLENEVQPMLIMNNPEWDGWTYQTINIKFQSADIPKLIKNIEHLWQDRFPEIPFEISFFNQILESNYKAFVSQQKIVSFFSFIAVLIALIGLFGLTHYTTQSKFKEIAIRKVNGATIKDILILINQTSLKSIILASVIAIPIAYYSMYNWLENFAYRINLSWWLFAIVILFILCIALLTTSWQSLRASMNNPVKSLKEK